MSRKFLVLLIFVTLIGIGFAAAADNTTDVVAADDSDDILKVSDSDEILSNESSTEDDSEPIYDDYEPKDYLYDFVFFHPKKLTTTYNSGKTFKVKVLSKFDEQPTLSGVKVKIKVATSNGYKTFYATSDKNGIAKFKVSKLPIGSHKVSITPVDTVYTSYDKATSTIKITKAKTLVSAPKVVSKHKKSKYFKIKVKNKATGKIVKNLKLKVKIGKKTYKLKTNSKGIAKFNVKRLGVGSYKVVIKSGSSKYSVSKNSKIKIKW